MARAGALSLVALLAACGGDHEVPMPLPDVPDGTSPSPIATYERSGGPDGEGPQALLTGVLFIEDGCLYIDSDGEKWLPLLPNVVEWDESSQRLSLDGRTAAVGESVGLGGGERPGGGLLATEEAPEGCTAANVWQTHRLSL